jgi:hypothetical protein
VACFTSLAGLLNLLSGSYHRTSYSPREIWPLQRWLRWCIQSYPQASPSAEPPLSELCDLPVSLSAVEQVAYSVHHTLLRPWSSRSPVLGEVLHRRARASFRIPLPSTPRFSLSHRVFPETTSASGADRVTARHPTLSLSWGFSSLQRTPARRIRFPRGTHASTPCVFRVRTSLDALLSFEPSNRLWSGRSWDSPFRAFFLPPSRKNLSVFPNPHDAIHPDRRTLAVRTIGPSRLRGS